MSKATKRVKISENEEKVIEKPQAPVVEEIKEDPEEVPQQLTIRFQNAEGNEVGDEIMIDG